MALQASEEKYLIYDSQVAPVNDKGESAFFEGNPMWFWNDRLILIWHEDDNDDWERKSERWRFTVSDLITNEARIAYFPKTGTQFDQVKATSLNKDFGFIIENFGDVFSVSLVKLNWSPVEFQLIEQFRHAYEHLAILVSNLEPTKFVLRYEIGGDGLYRYQVCKLDTGKIEFGNLHISNTYFEHYFQDRLFVLSGEQTIKMYDFALKKETSFSFDQFSGGYCDVWRVEWIKKRLYVAVKFHDTEKYGLAYIDLGTKHWTLVDLITDLRVRKLKYFVGNLLVYATDDIEHDKFFNIGHELEETPFHNVFKVYSIPVRYPQQLRRMAWSLVVKKFKHNEAIVNPYKKATRYLPFNTDLRSKWFNDEVKSKESVSDEHSEHESGSIEATDDNASKSKGDGDSTTQENDVPAKRPKLN